MKTRGILLLILFCMTAVGLRAETVLVKGGVAQSRIVMLKSTAIDSTAAHLLQLFVERISGANLPVIVTNKLKKGDIVLGESDKAAGEDGFTIASRGDRLHILTGGGKGTAYGVVTLLEQYLGVNYYSKDFYSCPKKKDMVLPAIQRTETPAFRYRQTQCYATEDPIYKLWYRLEEPREIFASNMWVHTFNRILPADIYGKEHPEYYSFINGERRPGTHSQWCLSNPEVFELAAHQIDSIFKANPGMNMISVSQNDGSDTYCHCDKCLAIDEEEGAHSGSLIRFVNKLAERFPDKQFSTLAYLYSMKPPKLVKPLKNVNIMLCDIDCKREVPLTDNASGREFVKALEGWAAISNNIFVWDYGINFDNVVAPFPNFHVLQSNIQLFHKNHVQMHFSQIGGSRGTDYAELRAFMVSKLMWNPYQNADSLMHVFLNGYYGAAAPFLYQYQKIMLGALLSSGQPLWIYDSPVSHKHGMLSPQLLKVYDSLYDEAERAVKDDSVYLDHVRLSRLSLDYAELEIARTESGHDPAEVRAKLNLFKERTAYFGVPSLNERNNKPADYCELYEKRFLPRTEANKARGAKVEWILPPAEKYKALGDSALTDDLYGGTTFVESWVGWEGKDGAFVLDLGSEKSFSSVSTDFLHQLGSWVLLPKGVTYSVSSDGKNYVPFGRYEIPEDRSNEVKFVAATVTSPSPVTARYIKVEIQSTKICPPWHYGVGYPAWCFTDEVMVR
jgi:hypothetical protein